MMKPSPDIFEALSFQSCGEKTGAFSHRSDARPACEANVRVACLQMMAIFKKRPTHITFSVESLEKPLL